MSGSSLARRRLSRSTGLLLTVLFHALGVWLLIAHDPLVMKPPSAGSDGAITYIAPLAQAPASKATPPPAALAPEATPPQPLVKQLRKPRLVPKVPVPSRPPAPVADQPDIALTQPATPPAEDFSARIEAARKRRSEGVAQAPAETDSQRANRIARDNIAFSQRGQGAERDQSGGVFQLRSTRLHNAEFMFRGWNGNFKRDSAQLIAVEQGAEVDIEVAVVKRMIALIRSQKSGEFIWDSHRLGRQLTLNANPSYETELLQFLLKEFYPTYVRTSGS